MKVTYSSTECSCGYKNNPHNNITCNYCGIHLQKIEYGDSDAVIDENYKEIGKIMTTHHINVKTLIETGEGELFCKLENPMTDNKWEMFVEIYDKTGYFIFTVTDGEVGNGLHIFWFINDAGMKKKYEMLKSRFT